MAIKDVHTNMDPEDISEQLLEVFQKWIEFALGSGELGGRMMKYRSKYNAHVPHPSGRMAGAIKADTDPEGNVVAVYIDKDSLGSAESDLLMSGHRGFSMKEKMLKAGKRGVKRSKKGYLYRRVPIADNPENPSSIMGEASRITNLFTSKITPTGGTIQINRNLAKMWVTNHRTSHSNATKVRTMSNKPGSARWWIPAMKPFNISHYLKSMVHNKNLKDRIIV